MLSSAPVQAQPVVPPSAEPSRILQQAAPVPPPAAVEAIPAAQAPAPTPAPEGAEKLTFTLKRVYIRGMSVYKSAEIIPLYKKNKGKTFSLSDVYALADRLTVKYRNDGYILSQVIVPPQEIADGTVHLQAVEGFIDTVFVQGGARHETTWLSPFADKIKADRPLRAKTLEHYLLLMNDLPGLSVKSVLSPSANTQGAADLTLIISQKPYDVSLSVDNRGTRFTGPLETNAGLRVNNAFGFYESVNIQLAAAPEGGPEMEYGGLTWTQPLGYEGTRIDIGGSISKNNPGYALKPFDVKGNASAINIALSHPFIRQRNENLSGTVKFDLLDSRRTDNFSPAPIEDRLRVLRLSGIYQTADRWLGSDTVTAAISKGLNFLDASRKGDANLTRLLGDPQFFKATAEVSRIQPLTSMFSLFAAASGQKSANNLLASEEFGVGGVNYGSAYDGSEITGEDGIAFRAELRMVPSLPLPVDLLQPYGFYDVGKVWDRDTGAVRDRQRALASAGIGLRAAINDHFSAACEIAKPLTRPVATMGDNDPRFFGALSAKF